MSNYRINAHGHIVLKPASGSNVQINGEFDLGNTHNQTLKKMQALDLSGATGQNQVLYDGSNFSIAAVPAELVGGTGINIAAGAVSVDSDTVALKSWVSSEITAGVSGLAASADLTAVDGRLSAVEGAYLSSATAAATYETISNVTGINSRVGVLESATSSYALATDLGTLESRVQILETDATNALTTSDLTNLTATDSVVINGTSSSCAQYVYKKDCLSNASESCFVLALDNEAAYISVECCIEGSVKSGVVFCERSYSQVSTADAVLRCDNDRFLGDLQGDEVQFTITAKSVYCNLVGNTSTGNMKAVLFVKVLKRVVNP